jgi:hypothetical protein
MPRQTARSLPAHFPQPFGSQILKAEADRQMSILRQEIVTELLGVLAEARELGVRTRLIRLVEHNLKHGLRQAEKSEEVWPELGELEAALKDGDEIKPAAAKRYLGTFQQLDKVHRRSLDLLKDSFQNIRLILDRLQPAEVKQ